jgi:DNA repair exonuclease SbcCD ATPase subunit
MSAKNFMPFGPEGIEIHFENYKNIVLIRGQNKDAFIQNHFADDDELKTSSNGTGKSSLQEILVFGLYGQTVKQLGKGGSKDVIHNKEKKDCKVEILFDDFKILRTRVENGNKNKNSLRFWQSSEGIWNESTEITQGTMAATQKRIDDAVGLSYEAFINICIFTDDQRSCFLECDKSKKMEIVENMLSLAEYRQWYENAKSLKKQVKSNLELNNKQYEMFLSNEKDLENRFELTKNRKQKWIEEKTNEYKKLVEAIKILKTDLEKTDDGTAELLYQKAQQDIENINNNLPEIQAEKEAEVRKNESLQEQDSEIKEEAANLKSKFDLLKNEISILNGQKNAKLQEIQDLQNCEHGSTCSKCKGTIDQSNLESYIQEVNEEISNLDCNIKEKQTNAIEIQQLIKDLIEKQKKLKESLVESNNYISQKNIQVAKLQKELVEASQVRQPQLNESEMLKKTKIQQLVKQAKDKKSEIEGASPFEEILENDQKNIAKIQEEIDTKKVEIKNLEEEIKYYDYWISGFGENGIRKWVVEGIIPELNNRINYWMQFLIDNKISVKFDNQLAETIERSPPSGDPYSYHAMSAGQKRRINLAISQSFAHIMAISSGSIPSLVFLDEVSTNIDFLGVHGIYNMICELSEDKQVFITTHDAELLRLLEGCDVINLVHEDGYTLLQEK